MRPMRFNDRSGGCQMTSMGEIDWVSHPTSGADIAVADWPVPDDADLLTFPIDAAATPEQLQAHGRKAGYADLAVGVADDVFITGLFVSRIGSKRNIPIVRVGNIAAMPEEPVQTLEMGPQDAYLVEVRSTGGLSGSPAFLYLGGLRRVHSVVGPELLAPMGGRYYLLGVTHGHYESDPEQLLSDDAASRREPLNAGIAVVIRAERLLEIILDDPDLRARRQRAEEEDMKKRTPKPDLPKPDSAITRDEFYKKLRKVTRRVEPAKSEPASTETSGEHPGGD